MVRGGQSPREAGGSGDREAAVGEQGAEQRKSLAGPRDGEVPEGLCAGEPPPAQAVVGERRIAALEVETTPAKFTEDRDDPETLCNPGRDPIGGGPSCVDFGAQIEAEPPSMGPWDVVVTPR